MLSHVYRNILILIMGPTVYEAHMSIIVTHALNPIYHTNIGLHINEWGEPAASYR